MFSQIIISCLITLTIGNPIPSEPTYENIPDKEFQETKLHPYSFSYDVKDEFGTTMTRKEDGDELGNKRGSYGYIDTYGISRQVEYVADDKGFRAVVRTNEPGIRSQNPANVEIISDDAKYHAQPNFDIASGPVPEPIDDRPVAAYGQRISEVNEALPVQRQQHFVPVSSEPSSQEVSPVSFNSISNEQEANLNEDQRV